MFLRLALSGGGPSPRVINVDGHPAYASAIAELKQSGQLGRRCRCRTARYLNNIIEQDHRRIRQRLRPMLQFQRFDHARRVVAGIELAAQIRKQQYDFRTVTSVLPQSNAEKWALVIAA